MKRSGVADGGIGTGCNSDAAVKTCARRFAFSAEGVCNYYLACDLDEGLLRYWPQSPNPYRYLAYSPNIEERKIAEDASDIRRESGRSVGIRLTKQQIKDIEEILTWENIESMRGVDDSYMFDRCNGWCYRDGWSLSCYFEGEAGWPPLELKRVSYCSFRGEELPFERLEDYIGFKVLHNQVEAFHYDVGHKVKPGMAEKIVSQAAKLGMEAIEEILWEGNARLIKELDKTALDCELSYSLTDDSFMVKYGNALSRACGFYGRPACEKVFGKSHTFGRTTVGRGVSDGE